MRPCMCARPRCSLVDELKLEVKGTTGSSHLQLPTYIIQPILILMLQVLHTIFGYVRSRYAHKVR